MDDPYAFPEEAPFKALPATTRGDIVLLLRGLQRDVDTYGPGTKKVPAEALKRILPTLAEHGLDRWANMFWADAERLIEIAETPHARSQEPNRQGFTASRVSGAFTQYAKWHLDQSSREEFDRDQQDRGQGRPVFGQRGAAGELRLALYDKPTSSAIQQFHNLSPEAIRGLVRQATRYLDQMERERPEELGSIYLGLHYDRKHLPASYKAVFSALDGPLPGQFFATQMMQSLLTYSPDEGLNINRNTRAVADGLQTYSEHYTPGRSNGR